MAQIIVMDGPGVGTTFELSGVNNIGRGDRCNIRLQSPSIGDQQATIKRKGNSFAIIASSPGSVLVNGQPVQKERKLNHGDMLTVADIMLLYGEESTDAGAAPQQFEMPDPAAAGSDKDPTITNRQTFYKDTNSALQDLGQTKHASRNMEVLIKVSNAIISKLEPQVLLQQLLDIIFDELPADRGIVLLKDPKGTKLWPMAMKKRPEIQQEIKPSRTIIKEVLDTKEGILTQDAQEDGRFQMGLSIASHQIHAAVCVPMVGKNEEVLGIIHLDSTRQDRFFKEEHLRLVTAIAMQASLAIENALLVQQLGEKKRIEQELTIASNIQMELLPKTIPEITGIEVYGLMKPAKEVGGDYYDFLIPETNPDEMYVCIGDVSGKGVPAGLVMVMARCFFKPLIISCDDTRMIVEEMNKFLVEDTRKDMFMSMLVISWDCKNQVFKWTGAGHEHLIIYRAKTGQCEAIRAGGIVLGMMKRANRFFKEQELRLEPGDAIILYTDGVTEAINPNRQMFELENLMHLATKYGKFNAEQICTHLLEDLKRFMANAPQHDDITLVAIKKT